MEGNKLGITLEKKKSGEERRQAKLFYQNQSVQDAKLEAALIVSNTSLQLLLGINLNLSLNALSYLQYKNIHNFS